MWRKTNCEKLTTPANIKQCMLKMVYAWNAQFLIGQINENEFYTKYGPNCHSIICYFWKFCSVIASNINFNVFF